MDFKELGHKLANLRKIKKLSQREMSENLHISRATISSFENGRSVEIGLKKALQITDYLGYEIALKEKEGFPVFGDILNEK